MITKQTASYHVTGITRDNKRFKLIYNSLSYALGINLYRGSVWEVDEKGKRKLIRRVFN